MGLYPIFTIFKPLSGILGYWRREDDSILFQQSPYTNANRPSRVLLDPCCFPKALPSSCMGYEWLEKSRYVGGLFSQTKNSNREISFICIREQSEEKAVKGVGDHSSIPSAHIRRFTLLVSSAPRDLPAPACPCLSIHK